MHVSHFTEMKLVSKKTNCADTRGPWGYVSLQELHEKLCGVAWVRQIWNTPTMLLLILNSTPVIAAKVGCNCFKKGYAPICPPSNMVKIWTLEMHCGTIISPDR